jgi:hypothetical protein
MPRTILLTLLFSLFFMICVGPAYTQGPPEDMQEETPEAEAAPQPEVPKQISTIIVEDSRLSVEFVNVNFGEILRAISQKAGFRIEGSSPAFVKSLTTKFTDLDMDKGLVRLFSMARESNYLIAYDAKGAISQVKVSFRTVAGSGPARNVYQGSPAGGQPRAVPFRAWRSRRQRAGAIRRPAMPEAPQPEPQPEPEENATDGDPFE